MLNNKKFRRKLSLFGILGVFALSFGFVNKAFASTPLQTAASYAEQGAMSVNRAVLDYDNYVISKGTAVLEKSNDIVTAAADNLTLPAMPKLPQMPSLPKMPQINLMGNALSAYSSVTSFFYNYLVNPIDRTLASAWNTIYNYVGQPAVKNTLTLKTTPPSGNISLPGSSGVMYITKNYYPNAVRGPQGIRGPQGPIGLTGSTGAQGPQGTQGLQGPLGLQGPGNSGGGQFIGQGAAAGAQELANSLSQKVSTALLSVSGQGTFTGVPTLAHSFSPWPAGTSNVSDSSIYVNPDSSVPDGNLIGAAVGGTVKFVVDAEGDIYGNNLILTGSTSAGTTNIAGDLIVQDNTILGDASTDTVTINANLITLAGSAPVINTTNPTATLGINTTTNRPVTFGSGLVTVPTLSATTSSLGTATATTLNGNTITAGTGTLTLGAGSTLATSATNPIILTSTGATNVTLPTSGTLYGTATGSITSAQFATSVSDETGSGALVFATSPVFTTPNIGNATGNISGNAATVTTNANLTGAVTSVGNATSLGSFTLAQLNTAVSDADVARTDAGNAFIGNQTIAVGQTTSAQTDLLINPTTKASGNLIDAQINSVSQFSVTSSGNVTNAGSLTVSGGTGLSTTGGGITSVTYFRAGGSTGTKLTATGSGTGLELSNNGVTDFGLLQFGGTTSSFPALKRSGATLAVRLADDSADAGITAATATFSGNVTLSDVNIVLGTTTGTKFGTATSQKLAFYNSTPIVQPSGDVATALSNLGLVSSPTITATTNANLTGAVTSVGNATSLGSFTFAQLNTAVSDADVARTDAGNAFIGNQTIAVGQTTSAQTDLLINPTTKASGNFIDAQVNNVSKFNVDFSGIATAASRMLVPAAATGNSSTPSIGFSGTSSGWNGDASGLYGQINGIQRITFNASSALFNGGTYTVTIGAGTTSGTLVLSGAAALVQFGGASSSFPAIKRSSALLAFRLADDSADAGITAASGVFSTTLQVTGHTTLEGVTSTGATGTGKFVFDTNPILVTPNLGTPSTLVGTNITGTASGLTAGNVTTNANLTGAVTSVGNATSLGSFTLAQLNTAVSDADVARTDAGNAFIGNQTIAVGQTTSAQTDLLINPTTKASGNLIDLQVNGSSKFSVDNAGNIVTPTSLSANTTVTAGGTPGIRLSSLGANLGVNSKIIWYSNNVTDTAQTWIRQAAAANIALGDVAAASPVNQTISTQGSRSGTDSNVAGANLTVQSGTGTGNAIGSSLIFNTPVAVGSGTGAQTQTATLTLQGGNTTVNGTLSVTGHTTFEGVTSTGATGTGKLVYDGTPTLVTPALGAATATTINGNTFTTGTYTLTGVAGKTLTFNNSLTLAGTDATTMTFPTTSATIARTDAAQTFTGVNVFSNNTQFSGGAEISTNGLKMERDGAYFITNANSFGGGNVIAMRWNADGVLAIDNSTAGRWGGIKVGFYGSATNTVSNGVIIGTRSSGTPAAGLGSGILFNIDSTTTADQNAAQIAALWTDATHATRTSDLVFYTVNSAAALAEGLRVTGAGHIKLEGVTSTGATGTGKFVFDTSPTLVTPNIGAATGSSLNLGAGAITSGLINGQTISSAANFTGTVTTATSETVPLVIGGTGTTSTLTLRSTSGTGAAGADIIFQTGTNGGTEAMRILNSGNVGIGTTGPSSTLHVKHDGGASVAAGGGDQLRVDSGVSGHVAELHLTDNVTSDAQLTFVPSATATSRYLNITTRATLGDFVVRGDGNVGIGTTAPANRLVVTAPDNSNAQTLFRVERSDGAVALTAGFALDSANDMFLGTSTNHPMLFTTNNTERMRIDASGNVGIGTTSPRWPLQVNNVKGTTIGSNIGLVLSDSSGGLNELTQIGLGYTTGGSIPPGIIGLINTSNAGDTKGDIFFATRNVTTNTAPTEQMRITGAGNVGIGTTSPAAKLDIKDGTAEGFLASEVNLSAGGVASTFQIMSQGNNKLSFGTSSNTRMTIDSSGNVGIGTTGPNATLQVNGTSIFGNAAWPSSTIAQDAITPVLITNAGTTNLFLNNANNTIAADNSSNIYLGARATTSANDSAYVRIIGAKENATSGNFASYLQLKTITAGGSENIGLRMDSSGNVGIGTTGPTSKLTIAADGNYEIETSGTSDLDITTPASTGGGINLSARRGNNGISITTGNNVGIGTGSPVNKLVVQMPSAVLYNTAGVFLRGASATDGMVIGGLDNSYKTIDTYGGGLYIQSTSGNITYFGGNVGINCTDPDHLLELGGTGTGCNTGTGSWIAAGSTAFTANSSREWKQNIQTYDMPDILAKIVATPARTFDWKPEYCTGADCTNNLGFIAQEFYGVLGRGDNLHVNGQDIMMAEWVAIQHLDLHLEGIAGTVTPLPGSDSESFMTAFFNNIYAKVGTWLADAGNGITDIFAKQVNTKTLCVSDDSGAKTCITKSQLDNLLQNQNPSTSSGPSATPPPQATPQGGQGGDGGGISSPPSEGGVPASSGGGGSTESTTPPPAPLLNQGGDGSGNSAPDPTPAPTP